MNLSMLAPATILDWLVPIGYIAAGQPHNDRCRDITFEELSKRLHAHGVADTLIGQVFDSGYFLKGWATTNGEGHYSVSDALYGNKAFSSSFELDDFIRHLQGEPVFQPLPPFNRIRVRNRREIDDYLGSGLID